ncbi:MAG TPA: hypothetical protein VGR85_15560 [Candidatus Limnocylindria bacterium]|jgi:exonuclease SbcD|nr:hypothetical protein [Candidatus Limnocylindria bacterium]
MTRILGVADLHLGATHLTTPKEQGDALQSVIEIIDREGMRVVAIAGDGTHHARPTPETLALLGWFYSQLAQRDIDVIEVAGNHNPRVPSVADYFCGRVHVAIEPRIVHLDHLDVACLPWLPDSYVRAKGAGQLTREDTAHALTVAAGEILAGFLAQRRSGVPMVLVAHGTVAGTQTSGGYSMGFIGGTEWRISVEDAARFDLAIVGHIHRHQVPAPTVIVPGSLLPLDFSEVDPHGVIVAEIGVGWRFVEIPSVKVLTLVLDGRPAFERIAFAAPETWHPDVVGAKLRVRATCDETTAREFPPSRIEAAARAAGASLVQMELEVVHPDRAPRTEAAVTPGNALDEYMAARDDLLPEQRDRVVFHGLSTIESLRAVGRADAGGDVEVRGIEARDFLGVREARVDFDGHDIYAITGPVGAGKSTIGGDAIRFALFGASRYGAKMSDQVVRQGADLASAAVELQGIDRGFYRVVRKVKRTARGATSSLDVLQMTGGLDLAGDNAVIGWHPLSTGKIADGQAHIDRILGGLTDETLVASSIVVQRNADAFMRARPEERKQLLAQAAGLSMFDELGDATRTNLRAAETTLGQLHAKAEPLRARSAQVPDVEAEFKVAETEATFEASHIAPLEQKVSDTRADYDRNDARADEYDRVLADAQSLKRDVDSVDLEIRGWTQKKLIADAMVSEKEKLLKARDELEAVRASIVVLEAALVAAADRSRERSAALTQKQQLQWTFENVRRTREREARDLDQQITAATRQEERLSASECPVLARISTGELAACLFLRDAKRDVEGIPALAERLSAASEVTQAELDLAERIRTFIVPEEELDTTFVNERLTRARVSARDLEKWSAAAEKIAKAEQVIADHDEAVAKLNERRAEIDERRKAKNQLLLEHGDARAAANRAAAAWESATADLAAARSRADTARTRAAELRGRLAELRGAAEELEGVEQQISIVAADVAALAVLVTAWRSCRVAVLEEAVIPAVEDTANDVLRRFPYGLQIQLITQRERRRDDGVSEALDVAVLGGHAPTYEGCSGGQRTTIDFALHVAIALVVSRRASSRLRFLFADEPEGLDEPGRAAFAATARWIHETFGLTVVVASHAADLIDALGGQRIDVVAGDDGSTVVAA